MRLSLRGKNPLLCSHPAQMLTPVRLSLFVLFLSKLVWISSRLGQCIYNISCFPAGPCITPPKVGKLYLFSLYSRSRFCASVSQHRYHLRIPRLHSILPLSSKPVSLIEFWLIVSIINCDAIAGRLEEALAQYKRSKENGVDRAAMHIRNVSYHPGIQYC